jgi:hypothetical protein
MKDSNLQILAAVAIFILIALIMRSRKPGGSSAAQDGVDAIVEMRNNLTISALAKKLNMDMRMKEHNEDDKILVAYKEKCPVGYKIAPPPQTGNPGCHVTCGGGGICGSGPDGLDRDGVTPILQKCCVQIKN